MDARRLFPAIALVLAAPLAAQGAPRTVHAVYTSEPVLVDGALDDAAWDRAVPTGGFRQFFPSDTAAAAHATEIRMVYDDRALYVAVRADAPADRYVVSTLRRDFAGTSNDNVTLMFDTFGDGTNAYLFGVTPYGVQRDVLVSGGGRDAAGFNTTWDEAWTAESRRHADHYTVEVEIPFAALAYPAGVTRWRFQGYRWDFQANERSVWAAVPQDQLMTNLAFLGEVVFDRPLGAASRPVAVVPYVNTSAERDAVLDRGGTDLALGGDAKAAVGRGLTLDLTLNPDFSTVEADDFVTNLTRFEVLREEKRQFFIENSDVFGGFGSRLDDIPFFSRRVGLARDTAGVFVENRILGGARLSGSLDETWRVGALSIQTAQDAALGVRSTNNAMVAVQRRAFGRSTVGAFVVSREAVGGADVPSAADAYNRVVGLDYDLASTDNRWTGTFYLHKSFQPGDAAGNYSAQTFVRYQTRDYSLTSDFVYVDADYRADLGFVPRRDVLKSGAAATYTFWPGGGLVNNHGPRLLALHFWRPTLDYRLTDHLYRASWGAVLADQSQLEAAATHNYVFLTGPFDPTRTGGTPLPGDAGYSFAEASLTYGSDPSRDVFFDVTAEGGQFFDGTRASVGGRVNVNLQPWAVLGVGAAYDRIRLPEPHASADLWLVTPEADVTLSRSLFWSTLVQVSTQFESVGVNSRLQWRFAPLSDLYLVYNDAYGADGLVPRYRSLTLKATYRFDL